MKHVQNFRFINIYVPKHLSAMYALVRRICLQKLLRNEWWCFTYCVNLINHPIALCGQTNWHNRACQAINRPGFALLFLLAIADYFIVHRKAGNMHQPALKGPSHVDFVRTCHYLYVLRLRQHFRRLCLHVQVRIPMLACFLYYFPIKTNHTNLTNLHIRTCWFGLHDTGDYKYQFLHKSSKRVPILGQVLRLPKYWMQFISVLNKK